MPIWLRNFTFSQMKEHFAKEKEEMEKVKTSSKPKTTIARPNFTTKAWILTFRPLASIEV